MEFIVLQLTVAEATVLDAKEPSPSWQTSLMWCLFIGRSVIPCSKLCQCRYTEMKKKKRLVSRHRSMSLHTLCGCVCVFTTVKNWHFVCLTSSDGPPSLITSLTLPPLP